MIPFLTTGNPSRRDFLKSAAVAGIGIGLGSRPEMAFANEPAEHPGKEIRVGIIGLSVHTADFTKILNAGAASDDLKGCRVVAVHHPPGNEDVEFPVRRLDEFRNTVAGHGTEIVHSIEAVIERADAIMLLTNDGRPHLEQALPVFKAGKPVFIDKPLAADLAGVVALLNASRKYNVPVFSSSALRYVKSAQDFRRGKTVGDVLGAEAYSPAPLQESHADLFWDGVHGVETLYTVMGTGCQQVSRSHVKDMDVVTGVWNNDRIGVFRGLRKGKLGFGGTVYGSEGIAAIGSFEGYRPLVTAIVDFFRTGKPPVSMEETLEIYAFMAAADESKRRGGIPVQLSVVLSEAHKTAEAK